MPSWTHGGADAAPEGPSPSAMIPHPEVCGQGRRAGAPGQWGQVLKRGVPSGCAGPAPAVAEGWGEPRKASGGEHHARGGGSRGAYATAPGPVSGKGGRRCRGTVAARRGERESPGGGLERLGVEGGGGARERVGLYSRSAPAAPQAQGRGLRRAGSGGMEEELP